MNDAFVLFGHLLATIAKLLRPGGVRAVVAENLLMKQQLMVINRSRKRAPHLSTLDRCLFGFWSLFIRPQRISKAAVIVKPSTLLKFREALKKRRYGLLYSSSRRRKPGPKGPSEELIQAIAEMKRRNSRFGCPRIAQQINRAFGIEIDKDVVRRVLAKHHRPEPSEGSPSWSTFTRHMKDSLWSVDLFRCQSILLKIHWALLVIDQFSQRMIGFAVRSAAVDGILLCRFFNHVIAGQEPPPRYLSSNHDPPFEFHRWQANAPILEAQEIKTVPDLRLSHPLVERLIGTVRREHADPVLFWNTVDWERKLTALQEYYNHHRIHSSALHGDTRAKVRQQSTIQQAYFRNFHWESDCGGHFQLPVAG